MEIQFQNIHFTEMVWLGVDKRKIEYQKNNYTVSITSSALTNYILKYRFYICIANVNSANYYIVLYSYKKGTKQKI